MIDTRERGEERKIREIEWEKRVMEREEKYERERGKKLREIASENWER